MQQVRANRPWNLVVNVLAASPFLLAGTRVRFYRCGGIDVNSTHLRPGCEFESSLVTFGPGGMVNAGCVFSNRERIEVGAHVFMGPEVLLETSTHRMGGPAQRAGAYAGAPVTIGDGCWIGARATVLPGVHVAAGCVIAAGAVVTRSTSPHGLYAGVPAVRKQDLRPMPLDE